MNARSRFEDIIQPYLIAIDNIPVESAAKDILTVVSNQLHIDPATSGDVFYTLWGVIFDYAQSALCADYTTGEPNDANLSYLGRLAALVNDVRAAVKSDADLRGKLADAWLAQFGWEARDRFNFSPCSDNQNVRSLHESVRSWTNLNSFLALVWTLKPESSLPLAYDYSMYSIWSLRETLEEPQPPQNLSSLLHGAAAWICILASGDRIFRSTRQWAHGSSVGSPARPGSLWHEVGVPADREHGFSKERWRFWKDGFEIASKQEGLDGTAQRTAAATARIMERIESKHD